ncbi:MAG: hypothetical protein ACI9CF_001060 [Candidatus Omnitrophota bacterium]|jgi:hypothetical protein
MLEKGVLYLFMSKYKSTIRVLSLILIICFSILEIAQANPMPAPSQLIAKLNIQEVIKDPSRLQIPFEHCTVKEVYKGSGDKLIIHIQDAHANLSGQQNLAKTLDYLMTRYDIPTVLVEGSSIDATLSKVRGIMPKKDLGIAAKQLLYHSIISGEEYLNLTSEHDMQILGIENPNLYDKNILAYKNIIQQRDAVLSLISNINKSLSRIKNQLYPRALIQYEENKSKQDNFNLQINELLLLSNTSKVSISEDFEELPKLIELKESESRINFEKVNQDQSELLIALSSRGLSDIVTNYTMSPGLKSSHTSQFMFLDNILKVSQKNQIPVQGYTHLLQYHDYLRQFSTLKLDQLLDEIEVFEQKVYDALLQTEDSTKLRAIDRYVSLLKKAYKVQMSSKEFKLYQDNKNDFPIESIVGFLNLKLAELDYFEDFIPYEGNLSSDNVIENFYEVVDKRDVAFITNTLNLLNDDNINTGFLVSGGYHTEHVTQLLRDKDVSYVVLTPTVSSETDHQNYEQLLLLEQDAQSKSIEQIGMVRLTPVVIGGKLRFTHVVESGAHVSANAEILLNEMLNGNESAARMSEQVSVNDEVTLTVDWPGLFKNKTESRRRVLQALGESRFEDGMIVDVEKVREIQSRSLTQFKGLDGSYAVYQAYTLAKKRRIFDLPINISMTHFILWDLHIISYEMLLLVRRKNTTPILYENKAESKRRVVLALQDAGWLKEGLIRDEKVIGDISSKFYTQSTGKNGLSLVYQHFRQAVNMGYTQKPVKMKIAEFILRDLSLVDPSMPLVERTQLPGWYTDKSVYRKVVQKLLKDEWLDEHGEISDPKYLAHINKNLFFNKTSSSITAQPSTIFMKYSKLRAKKIIQTPSGMTIAEYVLIHLGFLEMKTWLMGDDRLIPLDKSDSASIREAQEVAVSIDLDISRGEYRERALAILRPLVLKGNLEAYNILIHRVIMPWAQPIINSYANTYSSLEGMDEAILTSMIEQRLRNLLLKRKNWDKDIRFGLIANRVRMDLAGQLRDATGFRRKNSTKTQGSMDAQRNPIASHAQSKTDDLVDIEELIHIVQIYVNQTYRIIHQSRNELIILARLGIDPEKGIWIDRVGVDKLSQLHSIHPPYVSRIWISFLKHIKSSSSLRASITQLLEAHPYLLDTRSFNRIFGKKPARLAKVVINDAYLIKNKLLRIPLPYEQVIPNKLDNAHILRAKTTSVIRSSGADGLIYFEGNVVIQPNGERTVIEPTTITLVELKRPKVESSAELFLKRKDTWSRLRTLVKAIPPNIRESLIIYFDLNVFSDKRELIHATRLARSIIDQDEFRGIVEFGVRGTEAEELDAIALTANILPMTSFHGDGKNKTRMSIVLTSPKEVRNLPQHQSFLPVANETGKVADWPTQIYAAMIARWSHETKFDQQFVSLITELSNYPREHALQILRLFLAGDIQGRLIALNAITPQLAQNYPINTLEAIKQLHLILKLYEMTESAIKGSA